MEIYIAHPSTGEFAGVSVAHLDPVATDKKGSPVYTTPAFSTANAPPALEADEVAVINGDAWEVKKDYRGTKIYSHATKEEMVVTELGNVPFGYTLDAPGAYDSWGANVWETDTEAELAGVKQDHTDELNRVAESLMAIVTSLYPASERASWDKQEAQASTYMADNNAVTPLLDKIASSRGITTASLAGKIISKANAYEVFGGSIIGQRQAIETAIEGSSTLEEVLAIDLQIIPEGV